jgi:hypothetical protein
MFDVVKSLYRDLSYDVALASCFSALFMSINREEIEAIAHHILSVFPKAIINTNSRELKVSWLFVMVLSLEVCFSVRLF